MFVAPVFVSRQYHYQCKFRKSSDTATVAGDAGLSFQKEKELRRNLVRDALKALQSAEKELRSVEGRLNAASLLGWQFVGKLGPAIWSLR
ncbi:MAG: hypothetical protein HYV01_06360 [Deltaproteobacteria bacterium]|nr:hypothetical protein [Deltaproteobacteria bacterium]